MDDIQKKLHDACIEGTAEKRIAFASTARDVLIAFRDDVEWEKLSPVQRVLAYDTIGLLSRVAAGEIENHPRILQNATRIMELAGDGQVPTTLESAIEYTVQGGALSGFTESRSGIEHEQQQQKNWRSRSGPGSTQASHKPGQRD